MATTLGAPAFSFQYQRIVGGTETAGTKTISGLNINEGSESDNPDGITAVQVYEFFSRVIAQLGYAINPQTAKFNSNRLFVQEP